MTKLHVVLCEEKMTKLHVKFYSIYENKKWLGRVHAMNAKKKWLFIFQGLINQETFTIFYGIKNDHKEDSLYPLS